MGWVKYTDNEGSNTMQCSHGHKEHSIVFFSLSLEQTITFAQALASWASCQYGACMSTGKFYGRKGGMRCVIDKIRSENAGPFVLHITYLYIHDCT